MSGNDYLTFRVRKKPWYVWMLRVLWLLWILAWLEFAVGSWQEMEFSAYRVAVRVLILSVLLGLALYFWRLRGSRVSSLVEKTTSLNQQEGSEEKPQTQDAP